MNLLSTLTPYANKITGGHQYEVMGDWRKLHNRELHNLYPLPDTIRQIKLRRMRWVGHVARMGEQRKVYTVSVGKSEEKDHSEDQGVDGRMG
jgi:hypothetical protein